MPVVETTLVLCDGEEVRDMKVFKPSWDEMRVVLVNDALLAEAEAYIYGCEQCDENADINFDYVLDALTNCDPTVTEYLLFRPGRCPRCQNEVTEKTLVSR
jgi:hypothetical protein